MHHKYSAPFLFDGHQLRTDGCVLIADETGGIVAITQQHDAGDDIQFLQGCICPGFVNAHCHLELSHMRGRVSPQQGMVGFLEKVLFDRQAPDDVVMHAMHNACDEMTGKGIVAVGDISNLPISAPVKAAHGLYWHNFIEVSGFVPDNAEKRFQQASAVAAAFHAVFPPAQVGVTVHAPYSVSRPLMQMVAHQHPAILSIHNQESLAEEAFMQDATGDMLHLYASLGIDIGFFSGIGQTSPHWWLPLLEQKQPVLLVHNCTTHSSDVTLLQHALHTIYWCLCPGANLYIGNPLPDVDMLLQHGATLCLGTDSLAGNTELSILHEMQILQQHKNLNATQLLGMATYNGAAALGIADKFGHFGTATSPGILLLEGFEADGLLDMVTVQRLL